LLNGTLLKIFFSQIAQFYTGIATTILLYHHVLTFEASGFYQSYISFLTEIFLQKERKYIWNQPKSIPVLLFLCLRYIPTTFLVLGQGGVYNIGSVIGSNGFTRYLSSVIRWQSCVLAWPRLFIGPIVCCAGGGKYLISQLLFTFLLNAVELWVSITA